MLINNILLIVVLFLSGCATDYCMKKSIKHWEIGDGNGKITADIWCEQTMIDNQCIVDPVCVNQFNQE